MRLFSAAVSLLSLASLVHSSPYREDLVDYNINTNQNAQNPTDYTTTKRTSYHKSPENWREIPFYTILLDKFADGEPANNDYFGTLFEWDWRETQLRFGGDLKGLVGKLDYLQGMGVKGIFISGTPYLNMLWQADSKHRPSTPSMHAKPRCQVTHPSTSRYWTLTGVRSRTGKMLSTNSILAGCTS